MDQLEIFGTIVGGIISAITILFIVLILRDDE